MEKSLATQPKGIVRPFTSTKDNPMEIHYRFGMSPFGKILIASTATGLCSLLYVEDEIEAVCQLAKKFPEAIRIERSDLLHEKIEKLLMTNQPQEEPICFHLKGSHFQLNVWTALLEIPFGKQTSYGELAKRIGHPKAYRAVGTAVGANPIFFLIPCHRVIQANGNLGNYFWGAALKKRIIEWETLRLKSRS